MHPKLKLHSAAMRDKSADVRVTGSAFALGVWRSVNIALLFDELAKIASRTGHKIEMRDAREQQCRHQIQRLPLLQHVVDKLLPPRFKPRQCRADVRRIPVPLAGELLASARSFYEAVDLRAGDLGVLEQPADAREVDGREAQEDV